MSAVRTSSALWYARRVGPGVRVPDRQIVLGRVRGGSLRAAPADPEP